MLDIGIHDLGDGGGQATKWQRQHRARKNRAAALKARRLLRAQEKADLKKRLKKWRGQVKKAKAEGWVKLPWLRFRKPDGTVVAMGRPREFKKPIWIDMTGQRIGRLTVMRICPTSQQGCQRCRYWWVKCDCGSAERRVSGTCLRQGIVHSCGCLLREWGRMLGKRHKGVRRAQPLSEKMMIAAKELRSQGNVRVARMLEVAAPTVRRKERRQKRRRRGRG